MPSPARVADLVRMVEKGQFVESFPLFYAVDAFTSENDDAPRVGLAALIANEERVLSTFKDVRGRAIKVMCDGDTAVINWAFKFILKDGSFMMLDEIAYQTWVGDVIVREKFYYDPAQMQTRHPAGQGD